MMTLAKVARVAKHARGKVDAVDASSWSDRLVQEREIPAGAAPHVEDAVTVLEAQAIDRVLAQPRGNEEQPIEERNDVGEAVVALPDEIRGVIHPLIGHASLPHSQSSQREARFLIFRHVNRTRGRVNLTPPLLICASSAFLSRLSP